MLDLPLQISLNGTFNPFHLKKKKKKEGKSSITSDPSDPTTPVKCKTSNWGTPQKRNKRSATERLGDPRKEVTSILKFPLSRNKKGLHFFNSALIFP